MPANHRHWIIALCALLALVVVWSMALAQEQGPEIPADPIPMSEVEKAWVSKHKDLRLGIWLGAPPIAFRGERGNVQGVVPSFVDLICRKIGLTPRLVRGSSFARLWQLARAGEVDMLAAVPDEQERSKVMLLSEPFSFMPIVVVTRSDSPFITSLEDMVGREVAVDRGQLAHLRIPHDFPGVGLLPMESAEQALRAVVDGEVDGYVTAESTAAYLTRELGIPNLRVAAMTQYAYHFTVGVRKDWPMLLGLVNRALGTVSEEERKAINDYWTVLRDSHWVDRPHVWRLVGGVLLAAVLCLIAITIWNRKLSMEASRRKEAERQYRQAHEATRHIIENADIIIVGLDYAGIVRMINPAGEKATGYTADELVGCNWFDLVVPRERFPFVWDEFLRQLQEGSRRSNQTFESPILTKDGTIRHIMWRSSLSGEGGAELAVTAFGTDITKRLDAEEELRLTQFAMDNASVGVFRIQPSGGIVYANRAAGEILGYTRSELKRLSVADVSPRITREGWPEFWEQLKYNQMMTFELPLVRKNGETFPAEISSYYLLFKGMELAIGFFQDIAERKRVETLREDVERMVRHDLRSPTLAVQTLFKMFDKADNLTADQRELLHSVKEASRRMVYIIDMSRALYHMETGLYVVKPEPVDLLALTRSVLDDLAALTRIKEIAVRITLCGEPVNQASEFRLLSEEILCHALVSNLIKNAVEAAPEGSAVRVELCTTDRHTISVHNQGAIPHAVRDHFFEKYVTEGKAQGTGLGTYTAHLVAVTLGGSISFTTSEQDGTTVTVILPVIHDPGEAEDPA